MDDSKNDKVSIIIPVYNTEKYLRKCLDSVLKQTYHNWEALVIDDGSIDSSSDICDEYKLKDSRVQVFHVNNSGSAAARNIGIKNSKGKWIFFLDADDFLKYDCIEILINNQKIYKTDVVVGNFCTYYGDNAVSISHGNNDGQSLLKINDETFSRKMVRSILIKEIDDEIISLPSNIYAPWAKLIRSDILKKNSILFPVGIQRIEDFAFRISFFIKLKNIKILYIDKEIIYYRVHKNCISLSGSVDRLSSALKILEFFSEMEEFKSCKYLSEEEWHNYVLTTYESSILNLLSSNDYKIKKALKQIREMSISSCFKDSFEYANKNNISVSKIIDLAYKKKYLRLIIISCVRRIILEVKINTLEFRKRIRKICKK